jgi:DNA-binding NtrC family response regulator
MSQSLVMVVDDEPDIRDLVKEILEDEGYAVIVAEDVSVAREAIGEQTPDLVLLDIWMPEQDGISLLKEWRDAGQLKFPVVMISGHGTVETAVEATRLGAVDFIEKPLSLARLLLAAEKAISNFTLPDQSAQAVERKLPLIVGTSEYATELRATIEKSATNSDSGVLIVGERATGKLLIAQHIHQASSRGSKPFVTLRCDSLSDMNAERELLGNDNNVGYLGSANGGTLCLTDLDELPNTAQGIILAALESGELMVRGKKVPFDMRIVACCATDPQSLVADGDFNEALYYRLAVLVINTLPLRDHREDVPALLTYTVDRLVEQEGLPYRHFSVSAQNKLRNMDWPGNVLELINFVQRLLILGNGVEIDLSEVEQLQGNDRERSWENSGDVMKLPLDVPLREARTEFEKLYLLRQLEKVDGNIVELARIVGMERTHLYRKLRSVGIKAGRKRG